VPLAVQLQNDDSMATFQHPHKLSSKRKGDAAEDEALAFLQAQGLQLVQRNFRTPGRGGGEIDLIVRDRQGTLVFVEVRSRSCAGHGGALASIGAAKRQRIVFAARCFLSRLPHLPACRFDVVVVQAGQLQWIKAAFEC
jgi:putative endonuclease